MRCSLGAEKPVPTDRTGEGFLQQRKSRWGGRTRPPRRAKLAAVFVGAVQEPDGRGRPSLREHNPYFFARAVSFSPTRSLTLNVILPAFLSASTITWSPCSTSPSRILSASGSCTSF